MDLSTYLASLYLLPLSSFLCNSSPAGGCIQSVLLLPAPLFYLDVLQIFQGITASRVVHPRLSPMERQATDEIMHLAAACRLQAQRDAGSWSEPPPDVLSPVMCRLPSLHERLALAAVCRNWYTAVRLSLPCSLPKLCLALPAGRFFSFQPGCSSALKPHNNHPSSSPRGSYSGATGSQILFPTDDWDMYSLVNPFTGRERLLPVPSGREELVEEDYWSEEMPVRKLVVCPGGGLVAAIVGHERSARVALCKPEAAWSWSLSALDTWRWYVDMVFFDGKLYLLTKDENLIALEVSYDDQSGEPRISDLKCVIDGGGNDYTLKEYTRMRYLVITPGGLLMVCKVMLDYGTTTYELLVFEANLQSSQWVQVDTLGGDQALFVGRLCSRAVRCDQHDVRADQIFFIDDSNRMNDLGIPLGDALANVFDMKDGSVCVLLPMYMYGDGEVPATWLFREDLGAKG